MARVSKETIEKTRKVIEERMSSPTFPSADEILKCNSVLRNTIGNIVSMSGAPEKTVCDLLIEIMGISDRITVESMRKRLKRIKNRDTINGNRVALGVNGDTESMNVTYCNKNGNSNRVELSVNRVASGVNRDNSLSFYISPEINQTDLAKSLAGFFISKRYKSVVLFKTCVMALNEMPDKLETSEIQRILTEAYLKADPE